MRLPSGQLQVGPSDGIASSVPDSQDIDSPALNAKQDPISSSAAPESDFANLNSQHRRFHGPGASRGMPFQGRDTLEQLGEPSPCGCLGRSLAKPLQHRFYVALSLGGDIDGVFHVIVRSTAKRF
jgi:hypothetical protein